MGSPDGVSFMSTIDTLLTRGQNKLLDYGKTELTHPGGSVNVLLEAVSQIDPDFPLGQDPRELAVAHILRSADPNLTHGITVLDQTTLTRYKVIRKEDNPGTITVSYWLEKQE